MSLLMAAKVEYPNYAMIIKYLLLLAIINFTYCWID